MQTPLAEQAPLNHQGPAEGGTMGLTEPRETRTS